MIQQQHQQAAIVDISTRDVVPLHPDAQVFTVEPPAEAGHTAKPIQLITSPAWRDAVIEWRRELPATKSARTTAEYWRYMMLFVDRLDGDPAKGNRDDVRAFAFDLDADGQQIEPRPAPSTTTVRLAAMRSFYEVAIDRDLIIRNPTDRVKRDRRRESLPRGLEADQVNALLAAAPDTPAGARDQALIITAVLTGLRRAELLSLTAGSLSRDGDRVFYEATVKGGRDRKRELPGMAYEAICNALARMGTPIDQLPAEASLFPSRAGSHKAITPAGFGQKLARYADRVGLRDVSPHVLRHTAAKLRMQTGAKLEDVQAFLGHRSAHTTSLYIQQLQGTTDPGWHGVAGLLQIPLWRRS